LGHPESFARWEFKAPHPLDLGHPICQRLLGYSNVAIHPSKAHADGGFIWPQAVGVNDDGFNFPALVAQGDDLTSAIFRHG
jgi:hypothetical protein